MRLPESLARLRAVGAGYLAAVLVTAGITAVLLWWAAAGDFNVTSFGEAAKSIGAVSALAATVWAATVGKPTLATRLATPGRALHQEPCRSYAESGRPLR